MKIVGMVLLAVGIALFLYFLYGFLTNGNRTVSPIPDDKGVKVIFVTPTP